MTQPQEKNKNGDQARKPYEPPRIISREPLEAMAAICAPAPPAKGNPMLCANGTNNS